MPNTPAIEVKDLSVKYPNHNTQATIGITFDIQKNKIATLLGPNGAGKSTIIKAILGILPYEGEIKIFGKSIRSSYASIGYVPQRYSFDQKIPITVYEFLKLALLSCTSCHKNKDKLIKESLEQVSLQKYERTTLSSLSGGQLQRILLARALVHKPKLLILDEPEAGIDVGAEQSLYSLLQKMRNETEVTILIASHELDVVYGYSDQVICINKRLVCTGKPNKVLNKETFLELYGGDITFYTHGHKH